MQNFQEIYDEAVEAGRQAFFTQSIVMWRASVTPMLVGSPSTPLGNDVDPTKKTYFVEGGVCGFCWILVKPGNSSFANWLKKNNLARKDSYYGGVSIWIGDYGQSMQRKEAHGDAMAEVLRKHGIKAHTMSRMD